MAHVSKGIEVSGRPALSLFTLFLMSGQMSLNEAQSTEMWCTYTIDKWNNRRAFVVMPTGGGDAARRKFDARLDTERRVSIRVQPPARETPTDVLDR